MKPPNQKHYVYSEELPLYIFRYNVYTVFYVIHIYLNILDYLILLSLLLCILLSCTWLFDLYFIYLEINYYYYYYYYYKHGLLH